MAISLLSTSEEREQADIQALRKKPRKRRRPKVVDERDIQGLEPSSKLKMAKSNPPLIREFNPVVPDSLVESISPIPSKAEAEFKKAVRQAEEAKREEKGEAKTPKKKRASPKSSKTKAKTAKRSSKAKASEKKAAGSSTLSREVTGLLVFGFTLLVTLALISYDAKDPGFGVSGHEGVRNWVGVVGAYVADGLTLLFGLVAFSLPLLLGAYAATFFRKVPFRLAARNVFGALLFITGFVIILHVVLGGSDLLPYPAGGLFGAVLGTHLTNVLAPVGTFVLGALASIMGAMLLRHKSITTQVNETVTFVRTVWHHAFDGALVWKEKRRMLWDERDELLAEIESSDDEEERLALEQARKEKVATAAKNKAKEALLKELAALEDDKNNKVKVADFAKDRSDPAWTKLPQAASPLKPLPKNANLNDTLVDPTVDGVKVSLQANAAAPTIVKTGAIPDATLEVSQVLSSKKIEIVAEAKPSPKAKPKKSAKQDEKAGPLKIIERDDNAEEIVSADDEALVEETEFQLPPLKLLDYDAPERQAVDAETLQEEADKLCRKFADFGIAGKVREVRPGPVCTTYEFVPAPGIKVSRIASLADDIAMAMEAVHVRIVAPIPGKGAVGIEIPNERRETVYLKEIVADKSFKEAKSKLTMAIGKDIEGKPYSADLSGMPHVLISGTTGSGKSVSVNGMICSILYRARPDEVKFMMIDPKMLELSIYEGIPHLLLPPITDSKKASNALRWAVDEMERRYQALSDMGVRDLESFNQRVANAVDGHGPEGRKLPVLPNGDAYEKFPYIVIVVDEYADLLAVAGKEVEGHVMRLAQKARAAGIHVMLATQRPSVDVITGVIKANFPVRMGFRLASNHDSKTIVNRPGAERLLGKGDMLVMPAGTSNLTRVHGAFISEKELHRVVGFLKEQGKPDYNMDILKAPESEAGEVDSDADKDSKWDDAIAVVARGRRCSTSWLQRQLGIGYNRSARIVEMMEREGLVGPQLNSKGDRDIHIPPMD